ncbi:MAG: hypothetical protein IKC94_00345 [Lentisphaeria bacterium]|nr:hypothetical protein [Lentisphaeria bacterium]
MIRRFFILCLSGLWLMLQAGEPDLLFEVNFDQFSTDAAVFGGEKVSTSFANSDLQMRMFPGVNGRGNAINLENREFLEYPALGNFSAKSGTVTLWVAPQNWKPSEKKVQVFFDAMIAGGKFRLLIYKNNYANCFYALIVFPGAPGTEKNFQATSFLPDSRWPLRQWHRLDVTWDAENLKLYVDGMQTPKHRWHVSTRRFPQRMEFPEVTARDTITIGTSRHWQNHRDVVPTHRTAFDVVQIWSRPLSAAEIKSDYEKSVPSQFGVCQRNRLTIPYSVDPAVAAVFPVNIVMSASEYKTPLADGQASLRYDRENIYLDLEVSASPRPPRITQADGSLWEDDSVEFHLVSRQGSHYQFIVNSAGVIYDAGNRDVKWNSGARCQSSVKDGKWRMHLTIPRRSMDSFSAGDVLRGNVYLSMVAPSGAYCFQSWFDGQAGKMFTNPGNYAELRFGNENEALKIDFAADPSGGVFDLSLRRNGTLPVQTQAFILAENGEKIDFRGDIFAAPWRTPLPAGRHKLSLTVSAGQEKLLIYERTFVVNRPLELSFRSFPSKKFIEVTVDFGNAGAENIRKLQNSGIPGKVQLMRDGRVFSEVPVTAGMLKTVVQLPLPENLDGGNYQIAGKFGELSSAVNFRVPDMTPYRQPVADDHQVPEPWIPVRQCGELSFEILDRVYTFGDSPAPVQVTSRGSEMLISPPVWQADGKDIRWEKPQIAEKYDDMVKFRGKGKAAGLNFVYESELHFDGVYQLVIRMAPESGTATITSLDLSYAVPAEYARYILSPTLLPWQNDRISARYEIRMPNNNRDFFLWNTGIEKGFLWWPKSTANFFNAPGEKQITIRRQNGQVQVNIAIISRQVQLRSTAEYTCVFMATPVKPLPDGSRVQNMSGWGRTPGQLWQPMGWGVFQAEPSAEDCTSAAGLLLADPARFQTVLDRWKNAGVKPLLYGMPAQIATNDAEYDFFYCEWAKTPTYLHSITKNGVRVINEPMCGHTRVADLGAYRADNLLRQFPDLAGLYFDLSDVRFCENPHHGCGGIDAFGQPYLSSIALNLRQYMKRIYKVTRRYDRKILMHAHNLFNPIAHSFNDFWYPGEQTFAPLAGNIEYYYCEGISPAEFQSEYNSVIKGMPVIFLPQYARVSNPAIGFAHLKSRNQELYGPEYALRTWTPMLVHDVNVAAEQIHWGTCSKIWQIRNQLDLGNAEFRGYWFDDALTSTQRGVLVSWYILKGRTEYQRLIVIANFNRQAVTPGLQIKANEAGFDGSAVFTDLWENRQLTLTELNNVTIPGNHFLLIGVK